MKKSEKSHEDLLSNFTFGELHFNSRKQIIFGEDIDKKLFIKIQFIKNKRKNNDIKGEFDIIKLLNKKKCQTCPVAHEYGRIEKNLILQNLTTEEDRNLFSNSQDDSFEYIIQDYVPDDTEEINLADIMLSMIEQKNLGVYQADIKPANVRFDKQKSICNIIDYDQAIILDEETSNLNNANFFDFCSTYDKQKYGFGDWLRHFPEYDYEDINSSLVHGALDLSWTTIIKEQETTNTASGIYHTIDTRDIMVIGTRSLTPRAEILDKVDFAKGEKVLDIGCNAGLLSEYLLERGCTVTGIDNDLRISILAQIIANVTRKDIRYECMDIDYVDALGEYDTVMLFSVLHHTRNIKENAIKITKACKRIFLEARPAENGKQPIKMGNNISWCPSSKWTFESVSHLAKYFEENFFEGFKLKSVLGKVDKHRSIFEFIKE